MTDSIGRNQLQRAVGRRILVAGTAAALSTACEAPTGVRAPDLQTSHPLLAAQSERGSGVLDGSGTFFIPCLGEALEASSSSPFTFHRTVTPSGNVVFTDHFIPGASTGSAVGLTSGERWTLRHASSPEVIVTTAAGSLAKFNANIVWESETGERLHLHSRFQFFQGADGSVRIDRFEVSCAVH